MSIFSAIIAPRLAIPAFAEFLLHVWSSVPWAPSHNTAPLHIYNVSHSTIDAETNFRLMLWSIRV